MDRDPALHQFEAKLIKRQVAILGHALAQPVMMIAKFAATLRSALRPGVQRPCFTVQDHHVVHETWRHPEMARCLTVGMALFHKRNNPLTQRHWMWSAHLRSPSFRKENHKSTDLGILNPS
jgi:hypothetical protein